MKTKEQKRAEAIARAAKAFIVKGHIKRMSEQEYLDKFRRKEDRQIPSHSDVYIPPSSLEVWRD